MADTYKEDGSKTIKKNQTRPCPSGFYRDKSGKCVQAGVGPEYRP